MMKMAAGDHAYKAEILMSSKINHNIRAWRLAKSDDLANYVMPKK